MKKPGISVLIQCSGWRTLRTVNHNIVWLSKSLTWYLIPLWLVATLSTASLTFNSSTFCLHSVFMCFVWIWEQTAIISLYSFNWLVFITETECVYCAVRTGSLYIIWLILGFVVHFPSPYFFHFPAFCLATSLSLSEGRAGAAWELWEQPVF